MPKKAQTDKVTETEEISLHVPPHHDDEILSHVGEEEELEAYDMEEPHTDLDLDRVGRLIESIENDIRALKQLISGSSSPRADHASRVASAPVGFMQTGEDAGIDGTFDGERMLDAEGKVYQVPPNYASKSKLVEGDPLKLYITRDGKYVYKQLGPVERTTVPGTLRLEGNHYVVDADDGNTYNVLTACVTYYMSLYGLEPGGRVMAMIPATQSARWAVIDNIL